MGPVRGLAGARLRRRLRDLLVGKTERRLAIVILVTTMVPLAAALYLGTQMFHRASAIWYSPEIGAQLDRGVDVYKDYVRAIKDDLKHQTMAIAAAPTLREAAAAPDVETLEAELDTIFPDFPDLVTLEVEGEAGRVLATRARGRPVDPTTERSLQVRRALGDDADGPVLVATFAVSSKRLDELESAGEVVKRYHQIEASREEVYQGYLDVFALLLGATLVLTVPLGILLARGVTRRINRLSAAINLVAGGDLSVRVPVTGSDELTVLARSFNRMIGEMAQSRARIEFLQRMGAWQDMAQRLAHEIKNPLTPIQLAVQECHRKYEGADGKYQALLEATREIVEEEVGTLRRLVGNFSSFARLPHAELEAADLGAFLRECEAHLVHLEGTSLDEANDEPIAAQNVEIQWVVPSSPIEVAIDRQMLRRVLVNLVRNAVQAVRAHRAESSGSGGEPLASGQIIGRVVVAASREGDGATISIEDDGPGIAEPMRARIFDPYFTTKPDGAGLGLAIVKKIVVEHGGEIVTEPSARLGGARFVVRLPGTRILAIAAAAREARELARQQGVETGVG